METKIVLGIDGNSIIVARTIGPCQKEEIARFELDELVDLIQYRYATPWNSGKDALEKLFYILNEIFAIYSVNPEIKKEDAIKNIRFRIHENINK